MFFDTTVEFGMMMAYMSLEFIEMVPFISNDNTVTFCSHVWLL